MKSKFRALMSTIFIASTIAFFMMIGMLLNSTKQVYASSAPEIVSVELGLDDKVPTVGEKIFYPEIISVNGDASLKNLVKIRSYTATWQRNPATYYQDITDDNYVFEEGVLYRYYVQIEKTAGGTLDKEVVVTFAGKQSQEKTESGVTYIIDFGKLGNQYNINLSEGVVAINEAGEIITKAYKNDMLHFDITPPTGKAFRSLSITPQPSKASDFYFGGGVYELKMPTNDVTITAEFGDPIDEIRLTSQNFAIGANVEDFSVTTTQDANFSVEMAKLFDVADENVASGEFTTGMYMLTVLIKADEGYGFSIPLYSNDEIGYYYSKAISLDGWGPAGFVPLDLRGASDLGIVNPNGYFTVAFYLNLSDIPCPLDGYIEMEGYEYGKKVEDVTFMTSVNGGEKFDFTSSLVSLYFLNKISMDGLTSYEDTHQFVLGQTYVVKIIIANTPYNISGCALDYFTLNGIKPSYALRITDNTNGYIMLSYELPAVEQPKFDITFNANGGSGTMAKVKIRDNYTLPASLFTPPTGKQFAGWSTSANGSIITSSTYNVTKDTEFFAIWKDETYTVTASAGANGMITPSGEDNVVKGTTITFKIKANSGYRIKDVKVNGASVGKARSYILENITSDTTIIAEFELITFAVTFNANGGTGTMTATEYVGNYTLPANGFTAPEGKHFKGWATSATGNVIEGTTYNVTSDTTLYAIWEENSSAGPATPEQPENNNPTAEPESKGLGAGAIVGIVMASLVVLGTGGFAVVWFIVKKKTWADFVVASKKVWNKFLNLFKKK